MYKIKKLKKICQICLAMLISEVDGRSLQSVHASGYFTFHMLSSEPKSHFDFIFLNIQCFSDDVENIIVRRYPDHLPESIGSRFSLYLSSKLCYGIVLALKTQLSSLTSKCLLLHSVDLHLEILS